MEHGLIMPKAEASTGSAIPQYSVTAGDFIWMAPWCPRRHPDEISRRNGIPGIAEPVDASAFEHDEPVLHHMHLHHAERGAGLVDHGVDCKIETHLVRQKTLDLQSRIVREWMRRNLVFVRHN